jgi:K+-sensing histidine kinase KdpD
MLLGLLLWIRRHDASVAVRVSPALAGGIAGAAMLMTALEAFYLWRPGVTEVPHAFKYLTVCGDMVFISVLIYYTGFTQSPFFYVYFVFLISNCLRYGLLMSLFVATIMNVLYVIVLGLAPAGSVKPSVLGGEGLKILAFWAVALYGGSVSARLRRQSNQLRVYEETLAELRAELANSQADAAAQKAETP